MTLGAIPPTMKAVTMIKPFEVKVAEVPTPKIELDTDVILKVSTAGLCGSDLHFYRGHLPVTPNMIVGHEVVGEIIQVGDKVSKWKVGDRVITPFAASCGSCFYCNKGQTARCPEAVVFGVGRLPGCQAEYVRIPLADSFLWRQPEDIDESTLVIMADILPTGYFVAAGAKRLMIEGESGRAMTGNIVEDVEKTKEGVCVIIGCGPVGLCAISSAVQMFDKVFATDLSEMRLEAARAHGAIALPDGELQKAVLEATEGRGADAVCEVVGHTDALLKALDLVRPCGVVSSCGVHSHDITFAGRNLYLKNVRFQFGQCSVLTYFEGALGVLRKHKDVFNSFIQKKIALDDAEEYYKLFEQNKIGKVVFDLTA